MSYYNCVYLQYFDSAEIDIGPLEEVIAAHLEQHGIFHGVFQDIATLFETGESEFKLYTPMIDDILRLISRHSPQVEFGAQGRGEDLRDIWVREYAAGEATFSRGPFVD
jgi:hypothetical protein